MGNFGGFVPINRGPGPSVDTFQFAPSLPSVSKKHFRKRAKTRQLVFDFSQKLSKGLLFRSFFLFHLVVCDVVCLPLRGWIGLVEVSAIGCFCQSQSLEEAVLHGLGRVAD